MSHLRHHDYLRMMPDIVKLNVGRKQLPQNGIVYHVKADLNSDTWHVTCIGMECVDSHLAGTYYGSQTLPKALTDKLAVLALLEPNATHHIDGVGARSGEDSFWVFDSETSSQGEA